MVERQVRLQAQCTRRRGGVPYHVRVTTKSNPRADEVRLDLTEDELQSRFLLPYRQGQPFVIGGRTLTPDDIERIRITYTEESSTQLLPIITAERAGSDAIDLLGDDWHIADRGEDVTDKLITEPPATYAKQTAPLIPGVEKSRVVFVVHGRNSAARNAMFTFLRALNLEPLEWIEAVAATGKTMPYVGEILTAAFGAAQAVVVLMTPDDLASLKEEFTEPGDPPHEIESTGQARPNVIFEAGMAVGRDEDRTILVELGNLRPFSDVGGRHTIRISNRTERRQELARRLQAAGCPVKLTGVDWHSAGDFDAAVSQATKS
jgi:predicted nucleotide-binding protein